MLKKKLKNKKYYFNIFLSKKYFGKNIISNYDQLIIYSFSLFFSNSLSFLESKCKTNKILD